MSVVLNEATKIKEKENACDYVNKRSNMKGMCFEV